MVFTALPLCVKALWDQDTHYQHFQGKGTEAVVTEVSSIRTLNPYFYRRGQHNDVFNNATFIQSIAKGIIHALFIFCLTTAATSTTVFSDGLQADFWFTSVTMFTSIFLVVLCLTKTATAIYMVNVRLWSIFHWIVLSVMSVGVYFAWVWFSDSLSILAISSSQSQIWASSIFYLTTLANVGFLTFSEFFLKIYLNAKSPHKNIEGIGRLLRTGLNSPESENQVSEFVINEHN